MSLRLHAIANEEDQRGAVPEGARLVVLRNLAAIVAEAPYVAQFSDANFVATHARAVEAAFSNGPVLPVPPGTVFRTELALQQWMELHYVALSEGLTFIADRVGARVHVSNAEADGQPGDSGTDLAATAAELMRTLRRRAVAAVPLNREHTTGIAIGVSFLVERTLWREFEQEVTTVAAERSGMRISMTGPWPPYDFVRIELGA